MTTPNLNLDQPVSGADVGMWDDKLNANNVLIDEHDHTSGKGVAVPTAGIAIDADLPHGDFSATEVGSLDFAAKATSYMTARVRSLFVDRADNELYWVTAGGVPVKLTLAASINATLLGGITGDYTTTDADVNFDAAGARFRFWTDDAPQKWASLYAGALALHQADTAAIVNRVLLKSPAALAASYDITMPAALPVATALMQMGIAGQLVASNTVAEPVTFSDDVTMSATAVIDTAAIAVLGVSGAATFADGLTAAAGKHITLSTTGVVKHGTYTRKVPLAGVIEGGGTAPSNTMAGLEILAAGAGDYYSIDCSVLDIGDRLTAFSVRHFRTANAASSTWAFYSILDGVTTLLFTAPNTTTAGWTTTRWALTTAEVVTETARYFLLVGGGGGGIERVATLNLFYDRP